MSTLAALRFTNRFTNDLPADPDTAVASRQVRGAAFSRVRPTPVASPQILAFSPEVLSFWSFPPTPSTTLDLLLPSPAMSSSPAWTPIRVAMAATSSTTGRANSATAGPSHSAR